MKQFNEEKNIDHILKYALLYIKLNTYNIFHLYSIVSPFDNRQLPYNIVGNVHTTRRLSKIENRGKTIPKENSARISFAASSSFFWFAIQKLLWAVSCAKNSMVWKKRSHYQSIAWNLQLI